MKQEFARPVFKYAWEKPQTGAYSEIASFRTDFKKWNKLAKGVRVICTLTKVKGKVTDEPTIDSKIIEWESDASIHLSNIRIEK